jgi:hypothetical protein
MAYHANDYSGVEVSTMTEFLRHCARQRKIVHYDDAYEVVRPYGEFHGPHDKRLWDLLGMFSEQEVAAGRCALSAIVVIKTGDRANRAGLGFFELERKLGRYKGGNDQTWLAEIDGLFKYWPRH